MGRTRVPDVGLYATIKILRDAARGPDTLPDLRSAGELSYLQTGESAYPMRIGHEWAGVVSAVGSDVDGSWVGRRVTGDTMLGCGHCDRCVGGRQHLCAARHEIGLRGGWPGALATRLPVPVRAL